MDMFISSEYFLQAFPKMSVECRMVNEVINNLRCVRDQDLIDKPLVLYRKNIFIVDPTRSNIENRIIELEFFTKKKFDELVSEIKNFIPIHFNSYIRDYKIIQSPDKKKKIRQISLEKQQY